MSYNSQHFIYSPYYSTDSDYLSDLSLYDQTILIQKKLITHPLWTPVPDTQIRQPKQSSSKNILLTETVILSIQSRIRKHLKTQERNAFVGGTDGDNATATTEECSGQNSNTGLICCNCQALGEIPMKIIFSVILGGLKTGAASAKEIAKMAEDVAKKKIESLGLKKIYELLETLIAHLLKANPDDIQLEPQAWIARQLYVSFEDAWPEICELDHCINWGLVLAEIFANVIWEQLGNVIKNGAITFSMMISLLGELADELIAQGVSVICSKVLNCLDCGCWLASCKNHNDCCPDALHCERTRAESTGLCQPGVWVDGTVSNGYLCTHDGQCKPGLKCNKDDDGGRCGPIVISDCPGSDCSAHYLETICKHSNGSEYHCKQGYYGTDTSSQKWVATSNGNEGDYCEWSEDCKGYCGDDYKCKNYKAAGEVCVPSAKGQCERDLVCEPPENFNQGENKETSPRPLDANHWMCKRPTFTNCPGSICDPAVGAAKGSTCTHGGVNYSCQFGWYGTDYQNMKWVADSNGREGDYCNDGNGCASGKCFGYVCRAANYCASDGDCSGATPYCANNTCASKRLNGSGCTYDSECQSTYCEHGYCVASQPDCTGTAGAEYDRPSDCVEGERCWYKYPSAGQTANCKRVKGGCSPCYRRCPSGWGCANGWSNGESCWDDTHGWLKCGHCGLYADKHAGAWLWYGGSKSPNGDVSLNGMCNDNYPGPWRTQQQGDGVFWYTCNDDGVGGDCGSAGICHTGTLKQNSWGGGWCEGGGYV